jgi:hypothetical protein
LITELRKLQQLVYEVWFQCYPAYLAYREHQLQHRLSRKHELDHFQRLL